MYRPQQQQAGPGSCPRQDDFRLFLLITRLHNNFEIHLRWTSAPLSLWRCALRKEIAMTRIMLSDEDVRTIHGLLSEIITQYRDTDESSFLSNVGVYAHELPRNLRCHINRFRLAEDSAVLLVSGFPIDEKALGPTPEHLRDAQLPLHEVEEELLFTLVASLLGDVIGWSSQHGGRIIH